MDPAKEFGRVKVIPRYRKRTLNQAGHTFWRVEYRDSRGMLLSVCGHRHRKKAAARKCLREARRA